MRAFRVLTLLLVSSCLATADDAATEADEEVKGPKVTRKVFLDVNIRGEKAGRITMGLYGVRAPKTAQNIVDLCTGKHRFGYTMSLLLPRPAGLLVGASGIGVEKVGNVFAPEKFKRKHFKLKHKRAGLLSMAKNSGKDTDGIQFFITTETNPALDDKHVVFGTVLEGMKVVRKIAKLEHGSTDAELEICGEITPFTPFKDATFRGGLNEEL